MTVLCNLGILLVWRFYLLHFTQRTMGSVTKLVIFYTEGNRTAHYLIEQSAAVRSCGVYRAQILVGKCEWAISSWV